MITFRYFVIALCLLLPLTLFSEQKYGNVSEEELAMTSFEKDPEADAVVLFHKGEMIITPDYNLEMKEHKRIKILTEAGKEYANVEIPFWHEDKIINLRAVCHTPDGKEHKLSGGDIHEEKTKYFKKKVFAIPGAEVGSVIEIQFIKFSEYIHNLEPWRFQEKAFCSLSELTVYVPRGVGYSALKMNFLGKGIEETSEVVFYPMDRNKKCQKVMWTARDMHGIKKEPFMTAFDDYYATILFQLTSIRTSYFSKDYAKTWDQICNYSWNAYLKNYIRQDGGLEDLARSLVEGESDSLVRAQILYDYVRSRLKTAGRTIMWGDDFNEPKDVYKNAEGTVNEKNILLINLLNQVGIEAKPLLISKRSLGKIYSAWVNLRQFNRILVYARIGGQDWFLNTGSFSAPFGCLTPEYDVGMGLIMQGADNKLIPITPLPMDAILEIETEAELSADGHLTACSKFEYSGLMALFERNDLDEEELSEYLEDKLENIHSEAVLDSFNCCNLDSLNKCLTIDVHYHIPSYAQEAGNIMYCTTPLFTRQMKNPFVREYRHFPVDYDYEYRKSEKVKLRFPQGMTLSEKPDRARKSVKDMIFSKVYFGNEQEIEVMRSFRLKRKTFHPHEYSGVRAVYDKMVGSDQDQIVLVRNTAE